MNVPIGENFTDFQYVPLPGSNALVQPFGQELRNNGFLSNPTATYYANLNQANQAANQQQSLLGAAQSTQ